MKSLRAFWHWVDNEKPSEILDKHCDSLTYEEQRALGVAHELVLERLDSDFDSDDCAACDPGALTELREHWPAIRDLSLAVCAALEAMHEAVPEPARPPLCAECGSDMGHYLGCANGPALELLPGDGLQRLSQPSVFQREYFGSWHGHDTVPLSVVGRAAPSGDITEHAADAAGYGLGPSRPPVHGDFVGDPVDRMVVRTDASNRTYECGPLRFEFTGDLTGASRLSLIAAPIDPHWKEATRHPGGFDERPKWCRKL